MPDALFRLIEDRLSEHLDPDVFEACAADLLSSEYPGLAPIAGGGDAGMDGAIPEAGIPPLPLVTTTAADVIGNLRRNLTKYLEEGGERREAVVATSQELTPQRIRNLHAQARELGFTLRNVHDRSHFANLLYRDARWRRDLLGLTGDLPPLSSLSLSGRPTWEQPVVGREDELQRLRGADGDLVLIGQPGSGKTAVLSALAMEDEGFFLADFDMSRVADAVRELKPVAIFVDDAHRAPQVLTQLRRLRREIEAAFRIVAVSWPGADQKEEVRRRLNLTAAELIELRDLPRDQMAEIVRATGLAGPDVLIGEILDQAQGKPGLAVTLARLSLREGTASLASGEFLYRDIRPALLELVGERAVAVLAGFGVGGSAGMTIESVAAALGLPLPDVWEVVTRVEAGGVVVQRSSRCLAIEPPALREALVNEVFFRGGHGLPLDSFLDRLPDPGATAQTLIRGRARGGGVPERTIRDLLEEVGEPERFFLSGPAEPWQSYAWSGAEACNWILDAHPSVLPHVVRAALHHVPDRVMPELLAAAVDDRRELHSTLEHPLRIVRDWVRSARPGSPETLRRRFSVLDAALRWEGADPDVVVRSVAIAFDPAYDTAVDDPISRESITITRGHLTGEEMMRLMERWDEATELLARVGATEVGDLSRMVHDWAFPGALTLGRGVTDEVSDIARGAAARMLAGLVECLGADPGVVGWARRLAEQAGLDVDLPDLDPIFAILHPLRDDLEGDYEARFREQVEEARRLGRSWAEEDPEQVASLLVEIEAAAARGNLEWPTFTERAVEALAVEVDRPDEWLARMKSASAPASLVAPFLSRLLSESSEKARTAWQSLYGDPRYRKMAILILLRSSDPPDDLVGRALEDLAGLERTIGFFCARPEFDLEVVRRLLGHPEGEVAASAAEGLLHRDGGIPEELVGIWEEAVVEHVTAEHVLRRALQIRRDLADRWIRARWRDDRPEGLWSQQDAMAAAIAVLTDEERVELIRELDPEFVMPEFVEALVGENPRLFEALLGREDLTRRRLLPLRGKRLSTWTPLAKAALEAGFAEEEVANATIGPLWSDGPEAAQEWRRWEEFFEGLQTHEDGRIREVGRTGREAAVRERELAEAREQERRVRGW